ncbi:MAG: Xaa-Pro aminopeptidase [Gammaproteobacteria bacterium]|nr:Xaa-Pro aminopeptidase [Gammaproteobacteria bacterium]
MNAQEFVRRRARLMRTMGPASIAILPAAPHALRNRDSEYPYRPDSDFYYLTGFAEPEAVAVLAPGRKEGAYILFCRERDPKMEIWNGPRAGLEGVRTLHGADESFAIGDLQKVLPGLIENKKRIFYSLGLRPQFDHTLIEALNQVRRKARTGVHTPTEFAALEQPLHEMRLFKSKAELDAMRYAAKVSASAHRRAMQTCRPGMMEYQIEAELLHEFMRHGCRFPAYNSIVGSGANGCTLHYNDNNARLADGDLLLIDAGAEHDYYAADITRTFPVNGRFTPEQKAVYEVVLKAQLAAIDKVRPGNHWNEPHEAAVRVLTEGLIKLGLLKGRSKQLIKDEAHRRFYMHRTGHWLGMDVHDVGEYKTGDNWRALEPGMVLTVEPGLYIPAGSKGVPKKWWNIGIRIEDDVLVTRSGHEVLTAAAPKTVAEIETWMARTAG